MVVSLQGCGGADGGLVECHSILVYDWCAGGASACFIVKLQLFKALKVWYKNK